MHNWRPALEEPPEPVHQTEIEAAKASIMGEAAYPPDNSGDMPFIRPMLQGMLAGMVLKELGGDGALLKVREVETPKDSNGDYLPHFVVITESGLRLRVTVEGES